MTIEFLECECQRKSDCHKGFECDGCYCRDSKLTMKDDGKIIGITIITI